MPKFRKFMSACFGYGALVYLLAGIPLLSFVLRMNAQTGTMASAGRTLTLPDTLVLLMVKAIFLSATVVGSVNAIAWWTLKNRKRGARLWALAASVSYLLVSALQVIDDRYLLAHGQSGHPPVYFEMLALQMFLGLGGLAAFGPGYSEAAVTAESEPPQRVRGDGTHKALDAVALILQIGGTIALISVYTRWAYEHDLPFAHGWEAGIQWAVVIASATLIHESAHALVGVALGMKLRAFIIGPFQFRVVAGHWTFEFRPTQVLAFSGAAGLVPVDPDQSRWNEVAMIGAGPFANLISGAVAAALAYSAENYPWWSFWEYFALFATVSLVAGFVNLIPLQPSGLYSDGARIVQLFGHSPAADFTRVVQCVSSTLVSPRRPRDYDVAAIERASAYFKTGKQALLLRVWKCSCLLDRGDWASSSEALAEAERIYRESATDIPADLHTGFIIKGMALGRDRAYLREWWNSMEAKKPKTFDQDYWLAKSAFHWAENNISAAREAWKIGYAYLEKLPDAGTYNYDRDRYARVKEILDDPSSAIAVDNHLIAALSDTGLQPTPA